CGLDNIPGSDWCDQCGKPLVEIDLDSCELEESISRHSIRVLAPKPAVSVDAQATVREAIAAMVQKNIGCLLVEKNSSIVGVFTERDVLHRVSADLRTLDRPVSEFMTAKPAT